MYANIARNRDAPNGCVSILPIGMPCFSFFIATTIQFLYNNHAENYSIKKECLTMKRFIYLSIILLLVSCAGCSYFFTKEATKVLKLYDGSKERIDSIATIQLKGPVIISSIEPVYYPEYRTPLNFDPITGKASGGQVIYPASIGANTYYDYYSIKNIDDKDICCPS